MADAEQKFEKLQYTMTKILSNFLQIGESLEVLTNSFILNHYILNSNTIPLILTMGKSYFKLPSFSDLTNGLANEIITLRVF